MPLAFDQKLAQRDVAFAARPAGARSHSPSGIWRSLRARARRFLIRKLIPPFPPAEDFPGICAEDRRTFAELLSALPANLIESIRSNNLADGFWQDMLIPVYEFNREHAAPSFEFLDAKLEKLRKTLLEETNRLAHLVATHTRNDGRGWRKVPSAGECGCWDRESEARLNKKRKELQDAAERLWTSYRSLIRAARMKLAITESLRMWDEA